MPRPPGARNLTTEQRAEILRRARLGHTYASIAHELGHNLSTVAKIAMAELGYREPNKARRPLLGTTDART